MKPEEMMEEQAWQEKENMNNQAEETNVPEAAKEAGEPADKVDATEKAVEPSKGLGVQAKEMWGQFTKQQKTILGAAAAVFLVGIVLMIVAGAMHASRQDHMRVGQEYLEKARYQDALDEFLVVMREDEGNAEAKNGAISAYIALGNEALDGGNYQIAAGQFAQVTLLDGKNTQAIEGLASAQFGLGQLAAENHNYSAAITHYTNGLTLNPGQQSARTELSALCTAWGDECLASQDYSNALKAFETMIQHDPSNDYGYEGAIKACEALGRTAQARALLKNHDPVARELQNLLEAGNEDAVIELLYEQMTEVFDTSIGRYYGELNEEGQRHGKGTAYYADGRLYSGDWANGRREGEGTWFDIYGEKTIYTGGWKNDIPDGAFVLRQENDWATAVYTGNCVKGAFDGDITLTTHYAEYEEDACCVEKILQYENGNIVLASEKTGDFGYAHVYTCPQGHEWYSSTYDTNGIPGFLGSLPGFTRT